MDPEIQTMIETLRRKASEKVAAIKSDPRMNEVIQFLKSLNNLESLNQQPITTLSALFALDTGEASATPTAMIIRDEFVNLSPLEAAKQYLAKVNRPARSLDEIIKGITSGGGEVPNKSALRTQLNRSNDVKTVGDDLFGLATWYPKKRGRPVGSGGGGSDEDDEQSAEQPTAANATKAETETAAGE